MRPELHEDPVGRPPTPKRRIQLIYGIALLLLWLLIYLAIEFKMIGRPM